MLVCMLLQKQIMFIAGLFKSKISGKNKIMWPDYYLCEKYLHRDQETPYVVIHEVSVLLFFCKDVISDPYLHA